MRRVHREATERVGANRLGRNGMRRRVHREGLDRIADGNEAWRTAERRKRPCVRPAMFETGSCSSGGVWCTAKRRKRTSYGRNRGSCSLGGVWRTAKWDSTGYCSSPPSTLSSLHGLLFIHHRPPPASTGSCSSSLHHALLHRLLFNHPSTGTPPPSTVHPALYGVVLFIQPQPARSIGVLFI